MTLNEWLARASAVFGAVALALGLFAYGFASWVPNQFATLSADIKENTEAITEVNKSVSENLATSKNIEVAVTDALLSAEESDELIGYLAANLDTENKVVLAMLENSIPKDMWTDWQQSGKLGFLKASFVNDKEYLFVDKNKLGEFSVDERNTLKALSEIQGFELKYRDHNDFPGYSVRALIDAWGKVD